MKRSPNVEREDSITPSSAATEHGPEAPDQDGALDRLRSEIDIGLDELDSGLGSPLDVEEFLSKLRASHRQLIEVDETTFDEFCKILDEPPGGEGYIRLMAATKPWSN